MKRLPPPAALAAPTRRAFLVGLRRALVASGLVACGTDSQPRARDADDAGGDPGTGGGPDVADASAPPPEPPALETDPFTLGVASGDPLHDGVILWTRLALDPLVGNGRMPAVDVPVQWEVFADEAATVPVQAGWAWAPAALGHSIHVDVRALEPSTFYWYRFRVGDAWTSPLGRTRTFPAPDSAPDALRLAVACCQKYRSGWYGAYDHVAALDLDAVLFLGDYIYESGGEPEVEGRRAIDLDRVIDLDGFRRRYGGYRSDEQLAEAHRVHPWIVTWDDHEVSNDYAGEILAPNRRRDGDALTIRAAGYQAWYEHMPVRLPEPLDPRSVPIFRSFSFGTLAKLVVLDTRQYRDPPACLSEQDVVPPCDDFFDPERTFLGAEQEAWLEETLTESRATWNLVAQQVYFGPLHGGYRLHNPDQWDGYLPARDRVMAVLARPEVRNPLVLSGDVHAAGFGTLHADLDDVGTSVVAHEVLTTSISSGGDGADGIARAAGVLTRLIDALHYFEAGRRGFTLVEVTPSHCDVTFHVVATVSTPHADLGVDRAYRIQEGSLAFARRDQAE